MIGLNEGYSSEDSTTNRMVERLLPHYIESIFGPQGTLTQRLGLEERPAQYRMASSIAASFTCDQSLLVEAGTGVGKSLAYLIPGILHAFETERPCVVSTHTIALQEQIEQKDLAICRRIFQTEPDWKGFAGFKHALLMGRSNYLCGARLAQALETKSDLFSNQETAELERIVDWSSHTENGLLSELSPPPSPEVWDWVNADGSACNSRNCKADTCFYRKAREKLREAQLIIVNHSLLLALLASGHFPKGKIPGVLFPNDFVVVDEAHTLPSVATDHFGLKISSYGLRRQLHRLHNPRRKKASGLLARYGHFDMQRQVEEVIRAGEHFFSAVQAEYLLQNPIARLLKTDWVEPSLDHPLAALIESLKNCEQRTAEGPGRDELEGMRKSLQSYREGIRDSISLSDPDSVYWVERGGRRETIINLRSAPLDVAPHLRERFFNRKTSVILTSATLFESEDTEHFQKSVGAENATAQQEKSPFDYPRQMRIYLARDAPPLNRQNSRLDADFLCESIQHYCMQCGGGSLVLFTSYQDMYRVEKRLRSVFEQDGRPFYCQGMDGSRSDLTSRMRDDGNGILFGTDSFWTGVDIPGRSLSQVIITRLPFSNPTHPVAQARAEACSQRGLSAFVELTLPEALIQFRQGVGRLIRGMEDRGTLVILDSRILNKPYGKAFIEVLPHADFQILTRQNRAEVYSPLL